MKTDINKLLEIPIMEEWAQFTPVVNMTPQEVDSFFTRMLACEKYENDQGELYELGEAIDALIFTQDRCDIDNFTRVVLIKEVRVDILDALADCWYFAIQWHVSMGSRVDLEAMLNTAKCKHPSISKTIEVFDNCVSSIDITKPIALSFFMAQLIGVSNHYDFPLHTAVERVHASNLSKRNDKGVFEYNEHGKILKSKNYVPPVLDDLV